MSENQIKSNHIRLGETVSFRADSGIDSYLLDGWSMRALAHPWTDGGCARLQFHLSDLGAQNIILRVKCFGYLADGKLDHQSVEVRVNDSKVKTWTVRQKAWYKAVVPNELIKNGDMNVSFLISNPTAPFDVNLSNDKRKLGLRVMRVEIRGFGDVIPDTPATKTSVIVPDKKSVNKQIRGKGRRRKR